MAEINGVSLPFLPAGGISELKRQPLPLDQSMPRTSFRDVFEQEIGKLKFSAHAQSRLQSRDIALSHEDMGRIESAVAKAEAKGSQESLILLRDMAFIVSIGNKTVITAMQNDGAEQNVFTNIDSAVMA
ncbi:MAG: TIGR02530 family flagellar biosynthesis protein [Candidatus Kapaibacterium sp.]